MVGKMVNIEYEEYVYEELAVNEKALVDKAVEIAKNAYAPYSKFRVGAAVLLSDNTIVAGNNQENAAYPATLCAERVAILYAGANYPNLKVTTIAITAIDENGKMLNSITAPCGSCRQVILETEFRHKINIKTILASANKIMVFKSIQQLLPLGFNNSNLEIDKF